MILAIAIIVGLIGSLPSSAAAGPVSARDGLGRQLSLPAAPRRIVPLAPHLTELAVEAGLGSRLVALAVGDRPPPGLGHLPRIGGPGALDREALLALAPDLVLGWDSGNRPADLGWIEASGIPLYRSEPDGLHDIADSIRALGRLGGDPSPAERRAAAFEQTALTRCADLPPLTVYVEIWDHPAMSLGGDHWLNDALRAAGLRNRFAAVPGGVFKISAEARFLTRDLPRISLVPRSNPAQGSALASLLSLPGPRLAQGVRLLCEYRENGIRRVQR